MARWVRPALCVLRLWGPAGWRSLYTEVRGVLGEGHQGPSPGRTNVVTTSLWGMRKVSCAVGLAALNSGIAGGRRPISFSASASRIFGSGNNSKKKLFLQDIAELIRARACQRVVVMVGAGISTPSGIPDFRCPAVPSSSLTTLVRSTALPASQGSEPLAPLCRSPRSGLYSNLQRYDLPYPEAIFELTFFYHNPKPFFTLAKELHPRSYRPNVIHYFLRLLHDKELLLRLYTQNIDGLERVAGIPASKLVEAHGSFASATCTVCRRAFPGEDIWVDVMVDRIPRCPVCTGIVKPDIVFFGETLPQRFLLHVVDFPMADLLLILGTSLELNGWDR
ncbi:NAD-dependent protein deacetylase sirtuin-3, mitochondrial isoform X4 [Suricata suricatta]|uniref:NAD-dependent protein deacetylase sirtuin-3, mitochondrial isoform X4 n=1 Tax=Suricata suricatta TaxID=37032 RepID=UPI0011568631|nr:NAD-dependent protein deacetylase sirtuin-3, mitochondrial isoform X4 [Suricata suricatta]